MSAPDRAEADGAERTPRGSARSALGSADPGGSSGREASYAPSAGSDDYRLYGYCGEYVAAVAARMAFTDDERERWQPLIESAYLAGWNTALAARPAPAAATEGDARLDRLADAMTHEARGGGITVNWFDLEHALRLARTTTPVAGDGDAARLALAEDALDALIESCKGFGWVFITRPHMVDQAGLVAVNAKIDAWRAARPRDWTAAEGGTAAKPRRSAARVPPRPRPGGTGPIPTPRADAGDGEMQIMDRVRVARVCGGEHDAREVGLEGGIYEVLPDRAHRYVVALDTPLPATPATSRHPASFYDSLQFSEDELEVIDTPRADAGEDTDEVCHL